MVVFAASVLFGWGALAAGYGAYAVLAATSSHSTLHVAQAGLALLVATVSVSAGFLVVVVGRLERVPRPSQDELPGGGGSGPANRTMPE